MSAAKHRHRLRTLPLPPYGAAALDAVRNRRSLNTFIMVGPNAWNRHRKSLNRVVLPPDASPRDFDWSFLKGQSPLVIADDADPERVRELLRLLLRAPVSVVGCIFLEDGLTHVSFFRP
jgi:hypothetical protein